MPIDGPEMPPPSAADGVLVRDPHITPTASWIEALFASMGISGAVGIAAGFVIGGIGGLAVGMFVAIPGLWGIVMVISCDRLLKHPSPIPGLPARIAEQRWGLLGWAILAALTALGVVDILDDIAELRR